MKFKKISLLLAAALMCAGILSGCAGVPAQQEAEDGSDELLSGWTVVSGSDGYFDNSQTEVSQTENAVPADLSAIPAKKLMQVDFDKVFRTEIIHGEKYYRSGDGGAVPYSGADSIPAGLSEALGEALLSGGPQAFTDKYKTGAELTQEQFLSMTGADNDGYSTYLPVQADIDNDGADDIVVQVDFGGTGGFGELRIYKGSGGGYKLTDTYSTVAYMFHVINYNGKNYICQMEYDYETKYFYGCSLFCCADGLFAAQDLVGLAVSDYNVNISYEDGGFEGIEDIRSTLVNKNIPRIFTANDDVIYGTSENILEKYYRFSCDIDNDGKEETYEKMMHYPSNKGSLKYCYWYYYGDDGELIDDPDDKLLRLCEADTDLADNVYMFWIDKVGGRNVTYIYTDSEDRFVLSAYIIS